MCCCCARQVERLRVPPALQYWNVAMSDTKRASLALALWRSPRRTHLPDIPRQQVGHGRARRGVYMGCVSDSKAWLRANGGI